MRCSKPAPHLYPYPGAAGGLARCFGDAAIDRHGHLSARSRSSDIDVDELLAAFSILMHAHPGLDDIADWLRGLAAEGVLLSWGPGRRPVGERVRRTGERGER